MRDHRHTRLGATLLIGVMTFLLAACTAGPGSGGIVEGTEWILRSYAEGDDLLFVPETEYADAVFDRHQVSGLSSCNLYEALYRTGTRSMIISQPSVTLMACDEASMTFEQTYLANLQASVHYSVRKDTLTIYGRGGSTLLVYDASPRNPLLGTWNIDSYAVENSQFAKPENVRLEVVFGLASVGGFAGCNSFSGTYGTNGNYVRVSPLATTRVACEEEVMTVETGVLDALQGVSFIDRRGPLLLLTDRDGRAKLTLSRPQPEAAPSPSPSAEPSAEESPSESTEPEPTETAAPTKTPVPTAEPTASPAPTTAPTAAPSVPPIILPTVSTCEVLAVTGMPLATLGYPAAWSTVTQPAELACRYFDRDPITVPDDPSTLTTPVMVQTASTAYADAVTAATDTASWSIRQTVELEIDGLPATMVEGETTVAAGDIPAGTSRVAYLIDYGSAGTMTLFTLGTAGDETYAANAAVLTLMVGASAFAAPTS